jgi:NADP-dependent 3-hydroxy acid dehydrogenase YdfG
LRGTGVAATLLEPSATDTMLWDPLEPDARPDLPDRARMLQAEDVAAAVRFLLSRPAHVRIPLMQIERW